MNPTTEAVYAFLCRYHATHGYAPTLREIAHGCYMSVSNVVRHLDKLEMERLIEREPSKARGIRVVRKHAPDAHTPPQA